MGKVEEILEKIKKFFDEFIAFIERTLTSLGVELDETTTQG